MPGCTWFVATYVAMIVATSGGGFDPPRKCCVKRRCGIAGRPAARAYRHAVLKWIVRLVLLAAVAFGLAQLVPYRVHNPKTRHEPPWSSPQTRQLAVAACFDCHSNQTRGTWYENIAPVAWWINHHVSEGRARLNFSEWAPGKYDGDRAARAVLRGSMPPPYYTWFGLHADAKLTAQQRQQLAAGLQATLGPGNGTGRYERQ